MQGCLHGVDRALGHGEVETTVAIIRGRDTECALIARLFRERGAVLCRPRYSTAPHCSPRAVW